MPLFRIRITVLVLLSILSAASSASALTPDEMQQYMDRNSCPADLSSYNDISYERGCGQNYEKVMTNLQIVTCQQKVGAQNRIIQNYNDWMRECRSHRR